MRGKPFVFTEEQEKYIVYNWQKESAHSMKKKFGCSWYAICRVAIANGLELPESNIWTDEEEETLKELWGSKSIESIAKKLKRTVFSLKVKAVRMELGPMILNNYELIKVSDIEDLLKVKRDKITKTWVKLGLKLKTKRLTKNKSYYVITWEDLLEFLKQNQNEWDSRNLEINMLGVEEDWLKEKRKRDFYENPLWYRKWTEKEIKYAQYLFKLGKSYSEIAAEIDRTENAVADFLRNLNNEVKGIQSETNKVGKKLVKKDN